jgi:lactaldehyde reductase
MVLNPVSYHGRGAIQSIAAEIAGRSLQKALVASDPALVSGGLTRKLTDVLEAAGLKYALFSDVKPNPTVENVKEGIRAYLESRADHIVAVGGGSTIDTAKAIGVLVANPEFGDAHALEGAAPTKNRAVFTIAVPTTAGTAAEVTINYVLTDAEKRRKFVCVDPHSVPEVAVIDPDLMDSMPQELAAQTGMDALTHAIEGYVTRSAWALPDVFHLNAIKLIARSLRAAVGGDPSAREAMAFGQYAAGMGFSNVGLGIAHSMAHALGAFYDTPHGLANAILLPTVMEFNAPSTGEKYRAVACAMGVKDVSQMHRDEYRRAAVEAVRTLASDVGIPGNLQAIVKKQDIDSLAESAYLDACRPGNPREATKEDIKALFLSLI